MFVLKRIRPNNANQHIGEFCIFWSKGIYIIKKIIRVSRSGKSIYIGQSFADNISSYIQIVTRRVYIIVRPTSADLIAE